MAEKPEIRTRRGRGDHCRGIVRRRAGTVWKISNAEQRAPTRGVADRLAAAMGLIRDSAWSGDRDACNTAGATGTTPIEAFPCINVIMAKSPRI